MTYELLPIPPVATATDPISSTEDLRQRWRALMGPLGFGDRLLRFVFVGTDRRMVKMLGEAPITRYPRGRHVRSLVAALGDAVAESDDYATVALLLTRPGVGAITRADREWSTTLVETADELGVHLEPIFMANDERLVLVEPTHVR